MTALDGLTYNALHYTNIALRAQNTTTTGTTGPTTAARPPSYKIIGLSLAIASGLFIGTSFVLKKVGLLKANAKYNEEAGEGYGYLKNLWWWSGMTLMIIGEVCNFVAYAFTDAILVTPLGALSVVITTILSAIFLKERLSFIGKIGCFQCIIGSIIIVMNAPEQSAVADIQQMRSYFLSPGFLTFAGLIIAGSIFVALYLGPRYGKKSMFVYLSVCSLVGGLSVVSTQGLGAAVVAQASRGNQFNQWFLYVLLVFVVCTLLTEIVYLNKALNIFNAALVTPTYYVYFTSTTIITSAILFRGFHGTGISISTVVMGFLVICSGVVLLQLSQSAKDVPDAAVFKGDLDQMREVAEQQASMVDPMADSIRGTASIVRRLSTPRQRLEAIEAKRFFDEKRAEALEPLKENEIAEWDGLRRRKTIIGTGSGSTPSLRRTTVHPPLGMSRFPDFDDGDEDNHNQPGVLQNIRGRTATIFSRRSARTASDPADVHDPTHPVALTNIKNQAQSSHSPSLPYEPGSLEEARARIYGDTLKSKPSLNSKPLPLSPLPSPGPGMSTPASAKRQFSFSNMFRHSRQSNASSIEHPPHRPAVASSSHNAARKARTNATEEERAGLVKGDSSHTSLLQERSPDRSRLKHADPIDPSQPLYPIHSEASDTSPISPDGVAEHTTLEASHKDAARETRQPRSPYRQGSAHEPFSFASSAPQTAASSAYLDAIHSERQRSSHRRPLSPPTSYQLPVPPLPVSAPASESTPDLSANTSTLRRVTIGNEHPTTQAEIQVDAPATPTPAPVQRKAVGASSRPLEPPYIMTPQISPGTSVVELTEEPLELPARPSNAPRADSRERFAEVSAKERDERRKRMSLGGR